MTMKMGIIAMDLLGAREMPTRGKTAPKEDMMRSRSCATFLFSLLLFSLPEAYADEVSEGRNVFIVRCLGCHAFTCNKEGPRLGGLFGRKAASVEDYGYYSQDLKNFGIVWTEETLEVWFTDCPPSAPLRQIGHIEQGRISGSS